MALFLARPRGSGRRVIVGTSSSEWSKVSKGSSTYRDNKNKVSIKTVKRVDSKIPINMSEYQITLKHLLKIKNHEIYWKTKPLLFIVGEL